MQNSKFRIQNWLLIFCILYFAFCVSCRIPNLESPECAAARNAVREFYSFHFGNDLKPSTENLRLREKFLTPELKRQLERKGEGATDYFTQSDDYPKAFRVGGCEAENENKAVIEVLLFWKDERRSEQKAVRVEAAKENGVWLVNKVQN